MSRTQRRPEASHPPPTPHFLSFKEVMADSGLGYATIWRMIKRGEFPSQVQLSPGRVGFRVDAYNAWKASRTNPTLTEDKQ